MRGALFIFGLLCGVAFAQPFPSKPVRIIVPFPAGGTTDIIARLVGQRMSETLGQPVLVENRATYSIDNDFAGISIAVFVPLVITAHPSVPAKDLKELVALLARDRSLRYTYGSTGPGSFMHVIGEALSRETGIEMTHVPLKGAAPLKQELIAGRLNVGGDQLSSSLADIKAGKLRVLATNASRRIPELPEVPTVRELGFPVLEADGWNGLFAPAKTPREVIERLQKETAAAVRHPETAKRLMEIGAQPVGSTPAEQDAILKRQVAQFRPIIREMRIEN